MKMTLFQIDNIIIQKKNINLAGFSTQCFDYKHMHTQIHRDTKLYLESVCLQQHWYSGY